MGIRESLKALHEAFWRTVQPDRLDYLAVRRVLMNPGIVSVPIGHLTSFEQMAIASTALLLNQHPGLSLTDVKFHHQSEGDQAKEGLVEETAVIEGTLHVSTGSKPKTRVVYTGTKDLKVGIRIPQEVTLLSPPPWNLVREFTDPEIKALNRFSSLIGSTPRKK